MPYKILSVACDVTSCGYYRNHLPCAHLREPLLAAGIDLSISDFVTDELTHDAYVFSRTYGFHMFPLLLSLYQKGAKIIWDFDDDFASIPEWSPAKNAFGPNVLNMFYHYLRMSVAATVSTPHLAKVALERYPFLEGKITVLENLIDLRVYGDRSPGQQRCRVISSGSVTHGGDFAGIDKAIRKTIEDERFLMCFYGHMPDDFRNLAPDQLVHIPWGPKKHYEMTLSLIGPHVGVIPLADHPFNRCKSAIKYLEFTAAGAACIASDIEPFGSEGGKSVAPGIIEDGVDGILIPLGSHGGGDDGGIEPFRWGAALDDLRPSVMNRSVNRNAIEKVTGEFTWNAWNRRRQAWLEFYKSIPDLW